MEHLELYYDKPAAVWEETLPVGNGSLGGMVFGGIQKEVIGLNEESLWSGYPREKDNPGAYASLDTVRRLIFDGRCREAEQLIQETMLGEYNESYMPLGKLIIAYENLKEERTLAYRRTLDLNRAEAVVEFTDAAGVRYRREGFCSYPRSAMVIRLCADQPVMKLRIQLESELRY